MKEILSGAFTILVFILAIPFAYGQPLDTATNLHATPNKHRLLLLLLPLLKPPSAKVKILL